MTKDEEVLLELLDKVQGHLEESNHEDPPFNISHVEQVLIRHLQHRESATNVIAKILPILSRLWNRALDSVSFASCLPSLLRLWHTHTAKVSEIFSSLLRNGNLNDETTLALIASQFRSVVAKQKDHDETTTSALLLFLQDAAASRQQPCLYEYAWEFVIQNCRTYPDVGTRIVWDWALQSAPLLAQNPAIWTCLRLHWNENAAAALGNIVQDTVRMASENYPDWLAIFLLEAFRTVPSTRRRVMRTLKCLVVVDQETTIVPFEAEDMASVLVLGMQYTDDVSTQILSCQTAVGFTEKVPHVCSPVLEYSAVQCIETAKTDKLLAAAMKLLTHIVQISQWNRSAQCFANANFFRQLHHFLQRNKYSHAPIVATLLQRLQQKTTKTSMDKLLCQHLSILSLMLSVPSTQVLVLGILNRMVKHYSKELAADENLLNALVLLCMGEDHGKTKAKESVKRLILQLVPEL